MVGFISMQSCFLSVPSFLLIRSSVLVLVGIAGVQPNRLGTALERTLTELHEEVLVRLVRREEVRCGPNHGPHLAVLHLHGTLRRTGGVEVDCGPGRQLRLHHRQRLLRHLPLGLGVVVDPGPVLGPRVPPPPVGAGDVDVGAKGLHEVHHARHLGVVAHQHRHDVPRGARGDVAVAARRRRALRVAHLGGGDTRHALHSQLQAPEGPAGEVHLLQCGGLGELQQLDLHDDVLARERVVCVHNHAVLVHAAHRREKPRNGERLADKYVWRALLPRDGHRPAFQDCSLCFLTSNCHLPNIPDPHPQYRLFQPFHNLSGANFEFVRATLPRGLKLHTIFKSSNVVYSNEIPHFDEIISCKVVHACAFSRCC
mmetsp:Transcript_64377/g.172286  ORF Transcript_64377/g.172286 Transcript_64377/m.172286 type:complete len:369 (+) Transcript_64377:553-1659(+)